MKKNVLRMLWLLAFGLAACTDMIDNPATAPDGPEQQMADYTVMWYGHGGSNLDVSLIENMSAFFNADEDSYRNVGFVAQYKFSTQSHLQSLYKNTKEEVAKHLEPGTAEYEQAMALLEQIKGYFPYGGKTMRFVADPGQRAVSPETEEQLPQIDDTYFIGPDNADITCVDSLVNFINWAATVRPARKYILVLSDHGGGYRPDDDLPLDDAAKTRGLVYDDGHKSSHFTVKSLAQAVSSAKVRPACVYLDACLMNSVEYLFELAPHTDYYIGSTFTVPGSGGDYAALIDALSQNPDDIEEALTLFARATVDAWDEEKAEDMGTDEPAYHDITVTRTADLDAFGAELKSFTDRLIEAYQSGDADVKAKIDTCTAHAYKVEEERPSYDLIDYLVNLSLSLPDVFGRAIDSPLGKAFDRAIVYQQASQWLVDNDQDVDCSVLLGCQGHYTFGDDIQYEADGTRYILYGQGEKYETTWASTLDATYGQLRFDRLTGWSRWIRLNEQEPNPECFTGFNPLLTND